MSDEIAYRELKPGEVIQPGDEWQTESGRWAMFHQSSIGQPVRDSHCRRPYNITQLVKEQREANEVATIWQRAGQAAINERDDKRVAVQNAQRECDALRRERDRLANAVYDLLKKNHHLTRELARLQQSLPAADHIADANKMVESELERMAWELFCRSADRSTHDSFDDAARFIAERNRRRQANMATTDVAGDRS